MKKPKDLIEKYENYACGCHYSFKVNGISINGFRFVCYEHGIFNNPLKEEGMEMKMSVKKFIEQVTLEEGKKISLSVAQVGEVLKIVNKMLGGELYKLIRKKK